MMPVSSILEHTHLSGKKLAPALRSERLHFLSRLLRLIQFKRHTCTRVGLCNADLFLNSQSLGPPDLVSWLLPCVVAPEV